MHRPLQPQRCSLWAAAPPPWHIRLPGPAHQLWALRGTDRIAESEAKLQNQKPSRRVIQQVHLWSIAERDTMAYPSAWTCTSAVGPKGY